MESRRRRESHLSSHQSRAHLRCDRKTIRSAAWREPGEHIRGYPRATESHRRLTQLFDRLEDIPMMAPLSTRCRLAGSNSWSWSSKNLDYVFLERATLRTSYNSMNYLRKSSYCD